MVGLRMRVATAEKAKATSSLFPLQFEDTFENTHRRGQILMMGNVDGLRVGAHTCSSSKAEPTFAISQ